MFRKNWTTCFHFEQYPNNFDLLKVFDCWSDYLLVTVKFKFLLFLTDEKEWCKHDGNNLFYLNNYAYFFDVRWYGYRNVNRNNGAINRRNKSWAFHKIMLSCLIEKNSLFQFFFSSKLHSNNLFFTAIVHFKNETCSYYNLFSVSYQEMPPLENVKKKLQLNFNSNNIQCYGFG